MKKADIEKQQFSCPLQKQGCGGCPMLALPYEEQLRKKQKKIKRLLGNFGRLCLPDRPEKEPDHYQKRGKCFPGGAGKPAEPESSRERNPGERSRGSD